MMRDLRTKILTVRLATVELRFSHAPAANAIRYVLIGFVSVN